MNKLKLDSIVEKYSEELPI